MLWAMLHTIHCIQSGCIGPHCMDSTAYNRDPLHHNAWNHLHSMTLHGIHCIQSGCILPGCMESMHSSRCMDSTAYNRDPLRHNAWNPLHSMTLHGIHCIPSGCILPCCMDYPSFNPPAWNPLHSIGMLWAMLDNIHCIQSGSI